MSEPEAYELGGHGPARPPRLAGEVVVRDTEDIVIDALLADLFLHAQNCVRVFGDFHLAASGAPGLEPPLRRLLYDPVYRSFPWNRTRLWLTEELAVPADDPRRRWPVLHGLIVAQSGIPAEQAHAIPMEDEDPAAAYAALLREHLAWRDKGHDRLDAVLVALGPDGRIGGLRTGRETGPSDLCATLEPTADEPGTVALAPAFINVARMIAVYAPGAERRDVLARLATDTSLAARHLRPTGGELRWYVDRAACSAPV